MDRAIDMIRASCDKRTNGCTIVVYDDPIDFRRIAFLRCVWCSILPASIEQNMLYRRIIHEQKFITFGDSHRLLLKLVASICTVGTPLVVDEAVTEGGNATAAISTMPIVSPITRFKAPVYQRGVCRLPPRKY